MCWYEILTIRDMISNAYRERIFLKSTTINSVAYNPEDRMLEIEFQGGKVYHYHNVPQDVYYSLLNATSAGKYFNENIRDLYPFKEIE
jgi:hypothetical protein